MTTIDKFRYTTYADQTRRSAGNLITLSGADSNNYGKRGVSGITMTTSTTSMTVAVGTKVGMNIYVGGTTNEGEYTFKIGVYQGNKFIEFYHSPPMTYYGPDPISITLTIPELDRSTDYQIYYIVSPTNKLYYTKSALLLSGTAGARVSTDGNIPVGTALTLVSSGTVIKKANYSDATVTYSVTDQHPVGTSGIYPGIGYTDYFPYFVLYSPNETNGDTVLRVSIDSNHNNSDLGVLKEAPKMIVLRAPTVLPTTFLRQTVRLTEAPPAWSFEGLLRMGTAVETIQPSGPNVFGELEYRIPPSPDTNSQKGTFLCILSAGIGYSVGAGYQYNDLTENQRDQIRLATVTFKSFSVKAIGDLSIADPPALRYLNFNVGPLTQSSQSASYNVNATLNHPLGTLSVRDRQIPTSNNFTIVTDPSYNFTDTSVEVTDGQYYISVFNQQIPATGSISDDLEMTLTSLQQQQSAGTGIYLMTPQEMYQPQLSTQWSSPAVKILVRPTVGTGVSVTGLPTGVTLALARVDSPYGPNTAYYEGFIRNGSGSPVRAGDYKIEVNLYVNGNYTDSTYINLHVEPAAI